MTVKHHLTFKRADLAIGVSAFVFAAATTLVAQFVLAHPASLGSNVPVLLIPVVLAVFMTAISWNKMMDDLEAIQEGYGVPLAYAGTPVHALPSEYFQRAKGIDGRDPLFAEMDKNLDQLTSPAYAYLPGNINYQHDDHIRR